MISSLARKPARALHGLQNRHPGPSASRQAHSTRTTLFRLALERTLAATIRRSDANLSVSLWRHHGLPAAKWRIRLVDVDWRLTVTPAIALRHNAAINVTSIHDHRTGTRKLITTFASCGVTLTSRNL